jgi:hypothetical protein
LQNTEGQIDTGNEQEIIFVSAVSAGFAGFYNFSFLRGGSYGNAAE